MTQHYPLSLGLFRRCQQAGVAACRRGVDAQMAFQYVTFRRDSLSLKRHDGAVPPGQSNAQGTGPIADTGSGYGCDTSDCSQYFSRDDAIQGRNRCPGIDQRLRGPYATRHHKHYRTARTERLHRLGNAALGCRSEAA